MSIDAMAGYIYHLDTDVFAETTPEAYKSFLAVLEEAGIDTETLAYELENESTETKVFTAYKNFRDIFEARTGLQIELTVVEEGSEYNEVAGGVWSVINAVEPTEAAKKYAQFIEQKFFCTFG